MSRIYICLLLMGIMLVNSCMALEGILPVQALNPIAAPYDTCANIRNSQFVCVDCSTLAYCLQEGGNWVTYEIEKCQSHKSMYCNEKEKGCTLQRECRPPGIKFECQNPGMYPDPYDCKVYHNCNRFNEDTYYVCPSGKAYSVADKDCTLSATQSDVCKKAQYTCDKPGQRGPWPNDENIYYVCHGKYNDGKTVYYPILLRCDEGKKFDGNTCISDPGKPLTPETPETQEKCTEGKLQKHPTDCRSYYSCTKGNLVVHECPKGTHFDSKEFRCDYGNC